MHLLVNKLALILQTFIPRNICSLLHGALHWSNLIVYRFLLFFWRGVGEGAIFYLLFYSLKLEILEHFDFLSNIFCWQWNIQNKSLLRWPTKASSVIILSSLFEIVQEIVVIQGTCWWPMFSVLFLSLLAKQLDFLLLHKKLANSNDGGVGVCKLWGPTQKFSGLALGDQIKFYFSTWSPYSKI